MYVARGLKLSSSRNTFTRCTRALRPRSLPCRLRVTANHDLVPVRPVVPTHRSRKPVAHFRGASGMCQDKIRTDLPKLLRLLWVYTWVRVARPETSQIRPLLPPVTRAGSLALRLSPPRHPRRHRPFLHCRGQGFLAPQHSRRARPQYPTPLMHNRIDAQKDMLHNRHG